MLSKRGEHAKLCGRDRRGAPGDANLLRPEIDLKVTDRDGRRRRDRSCACPPQQGTISDGTSGWFGLGPISVAPEHQGQGLDALLMEHALTELRASGAAGCVVLEAPSYYSRFGFNAEPSLVLLGFPAEYFQAISFNGFLPSGNVTYRDSFQATAYNSFKPTLLRGAA